MRLTEEICAYCPDCGARVNLHGEHSCFPGDRRLTAVQLDSLMLEVDDPLGYMWLIRISHRLRQTLNGMEKYRERAEMARKVIGMMEGNDTPVKESQMRECAYCPNSKHPSGLCSKHLRMVQ